MAIYKRQYTGYAGQMTSRWPRFLILTRCSYARLFQSRFVVLFLTLCFCYPLGCAGYVYISHNPALMMLFNGGGGPGPRIDGRFFYYFSVIQGTLAYLLAAFVGPSLVAPDLVNGAMPLYLCRPFSRSEYVAGKLAVLLFLLSLTTWVPAMALYLIQATLAGWDWVGVNLWLAGAIFVGLGVWIMVLSLIALALSAWVKWKIAAGAMVLGVFFGGAVFGAVINRIARTNHDTVVNLNQVARTIWSDLFRYDSGTDMSLKDAWIALGATCLICLWLLAKRIRAFEVIR